MTVIDQFGADENNNNVAIIFMISRKCSKHVVLLACHHFKTNTWKNFQIRFKLNLVVIRPKIRRIKSKLVSQIFIAMIFFGKKSEDRAKQRISAQMPHVMCIFSYCDELNRILGFRKVIRKLLSLVTEQ